MRNLGDIPRCSFALQIAVQHGRRFRSDDSGASRVRTDDPALRYGWIRTIAGNGQVHGRVHLGTSGRGIVVGEPEDKQG